MLFKKTSLEPFGVLLEAVRPKTDVRALDTSLLRELLWQEGILVLRGFETFAGAEDFADYCERWGEISLWPFGKVLELVEHAQPKDHIFDHHYVPMHWDGMYRPQVPEFQVFHCVQAPPEGHGGRTTFSNTSLVLEQATPELRDTWSRVTGEYQRKMEFYHSKTVAPLIARHPTRGYPVIRYCEPTSADDSTFVNHPDIVFRGVEATELDAFHRDLREALYHPASFYAHTWQNGDVVVTDNHTLLHGREGFTSGAPRHLRRVHILGSPALDNPHLVFHE